MAAAARRAVGEMAFLNKDEKQRLQAKIREAEQKTSGELVTVIARESDPYSYIPLLWAAMAALAVPVVALTLDLPWSLSLVSILQMAVFLLLGLVLRWPP